MKVSLNWLNEFVDLKSIKIDDIVSRFSLTTAEIEGYEIKGPDPKVVVAEVKTCKKIETSNHLSELTVFDGKKNIPVVCGAPNVRAGIKVAFAPAGAKVGDVILEKVKLGGAESHGMCLSPRELGISEDHEGIIELDMNLKTGESVSKAMPYICDTIIEIDNTTITNRPDLWGHYGIARELAVIFNRKLLPLATADLKRFDGLPKLDIAIENRRDCYAYGMIRIEGITQETSPLPMQVRLFYLDINPHNFLVDLSNYIMLETGQPNHAFDAAKIGKISVGNVTESGKFETLKDQVINIDKDMLFIKSDGKPVALAGIIGGKNSEIDSATKDCQFEFATFDPACVRKTATKVGIRTDASARFEKSLDTNLIETACARTAYLLGKLDKDARVISSFTAEKAHETLPIKLEIDTAYTEKFCGTKFNWVTAAMKMAGLGFAPTVKDGKMFVTSPTWRATKDVTLSADVIEEIVRTYGYDNIVPAAPRVDIYPTVILPQKKLVNSLKDALSTTYACQEVHTYLWSDEPSNLRVVNSCVKGCDFVRESLIPSILGVAEKNRANFPDIRIFEIGEVYDKTERKHLCICVPSYKELAQIVRELFGAKFIIGGAKGDVSKYLHPKNNAAILIGKAAVGMIGVVPGKCETAVAEIDLDVVTIKGEVSFAQPSKYQKNHLDFTFETKKTYGDVEAIFEKFSHPLNMGFRLKDIYRTAVTIDFTVGSGERTLTAADINDIWGKIIEHGRKNGLTLKQ